MILLPGGESGRSPRGLLLTFVTQTGISLAAGTAVGSLTTSLLKDFARMWCVSCGIGVRFPDVHLSAACAILPRARCSVSPSPAFDVRLWNERENCA